MKRGRPLKSGEIRSAALTVRIPSSVLLVFQGLALQRKVSQADLIIDLITKAK